MTDLEHLGDALKILRGIRGLSQAALADQSDTAVSLISRYENDLAHPRLDTLVRLLNAMGFSFEDLGRALARADGLYDDLDKEPPRPQGQYQPSAFLMLPLPQDVEGELSSTLTRVLGGYHNLTQFLTRTLAEQAARSALRGAVGSEPKKNPKKGEPEGGDPT